MQSKNSVVSGVKWTSASTLGRRVLALLANIILARLLTPADFGMVAMAAVLLGFIEIFKSLGTGAAIVQRKELNEHLLSSIFWFNVLFGVVATLATVAIAPATAAFYGEPRLAAIVAAMAISFLLSAVAVVHTNLLTRDMDFVALAKIEVAAAVISYAVAIGAALLGHGVWSLVYQVITNSALTLVFTWFASSWRPRMVFSFSEVRSVMSYSLNLSGYNIFYYFAQNADNLLIGRFLGSEALGFYDLAYRLMQFPMQAIAGVFGRVMMPYYARAQDDLPRFRQAFMNVAVAIAFVSFPLMLGLVAVREHFVETVFGPAWLSIVPLLALFAPLGAIRAVLTTTGSIFMATGHTGLQLRWGIFSNLIIIAALALGLQWGMLGVATSFTIASVLLLYPNFAIPFRLIGLGVPQMARALVPTLACSLLMYATIVGLDTLLSGWSGHAQLLGMLVGAGVASYALFTWSFNRALLNEFLLTAGLKK